MALLELENLISFNAMYAGTGPGLTDFYSLLMKKVSFKVMDLSYWISISVPRDLTSLSLLGSLSLQRIFSSFVYTEKTSNGETEVQQVSNKSSLCRACVHACVCTCLPGYAWRACARHGRCLSCAELSPAALNTCTSHQRKKGVY